MSQLKDNHKINKKVKNKQNKRASIVIYTAFTKNYDNLFNHHYVSKDIDYVCFTDAKIDNPGVWEIKKMHHTALDNNRKAKEYKVLPHKFLKNYKYSLWIDSNIDILSDTLEKNIKKLIKQKQKIALQPHFKRNCIYEEAIACLNLNKDNPETIIRQIAFLKKEKYPDNYGLSENGLIFRKHHDPQIITLMEAWWNMIINFSYRDQLSLYYIFWKHHFKPQVRLINQNFRFMFTDFNFVNHNKTVVSTIYPIQKIPKYSNVMQQIIAIGDNKEYAISTSLGHLRNIKNIKINLLTGYFCTLNVTDIQINSKSVSIEKSLSSTNGTFVDHNTINFLQTSFPEISIRSQENIYKFSISGFIHTYNTEELYLNTLSTINEIRSSRTFKLQQLFHKLFRRQK